MSFRVVPMVHKKKRGGWKSGGLDHDDLLPGKPPFHGRLNPPGSYVPRILLRHALAVAAAVGALSIGCALGILV